MKTVNANAEKAVERKANLDATVAAYCESGGHEYQDLAPLPMVSYFVGDF